MCVTVLGLDRVQLIRTTDISIDGPQKLQQEIMSVWTENGIKRFYEK